MERGVERAVAAKRNLAEVLRNEGDKHILGGEGKEGEADRRQPGWVN